MTYAKRAVDICAHRPLKSFEDFQAEMKQAELPFTAWHAECTGTEIDLIIFTDGSGFFAELNQGYNLWPLDGYDDENMEDELLPVMKNPEAITAAGAKLWSVESFDPDLCAPLTQHIKTCVKKHPDPPEALRDLIWDPHHPFEWQQATGESEAQQILILCATFLYPAADEIVIKADIRPGMSNAQHTRDKGMISMFSSSGIGADYALNMGATFRGLPHAEISCDEGDYKDLAAANEPMAWLSAQVLEKLGMPVGWEVDYNDGHRSRMSGYSANSESIVIEINGQISNHQSLDRDLTLARMLARHDLLSPFQDILSDHGFSQLPDP